MRKAPPPPKNGTNSTEDVEKRQSCWKRSTPLQAKTIFVTKRARNCSGHAPGHCKEIDSEGPETTPETPKYARNRKDDGKMNTPKPQRERPSPPENARNRSQTDRRGRQSLRLDSAQKQARDRSEDASFSVRYMGPKTRTTPQENAPPKTVRQEEKIQDGPKQRIAH